MQAFDELRRIARAAGASASVFLRDVGHGLLEISHNSLAALGLAVVSVAIVVAGNRELLEQAETQALEWLQTRHEAREEASGNVLAAVSEPDAVVRATATDPAQLTKPQSAVALWIARRYKVAPEPIARLVQEAWHIGERAGLDPTLILAIMAIESSFNPFAQSPVGAQGLMQVMTRVHDAKYEPFGGTHAAFDPLTNLRVGVQVLKECIARAGSLEAGLRFYVGAGNSTDDSGYAGRVLSEQSLLQRVAQGKAVPANTPAPTAVPSAPAFAPAAGAGSPPPAVPQPQVPGPAAHDDDRVALLTRQAQTSAPVH
jgi:hypothetical protein